MNMDYIVDALVVVAVCAGIFWIIESVDDKID